MVIVMVELPEGLTVSASLTGMASQGIVLSIDGAFRAGDLARTGSITNKTDTRMSLFMYTL